MFTINGSKYHYTGPAVGYRLGCPVWQRVRSHPWFLYSFKCHVYGGRGSYIPAPRYVSGPLKASSAAVAFQIQLRRLHEGYIRNLIHSLPSSQKKKKNPPVSSARRYREQNRPGGGGVLSVFLAAESDHGARDGFHGFCDRSLRSRPSIPTLLRRHHTC